MEVYEDYESELYCDGCGNLLDTDTQEKVFCKRCE